MERDARTREGWEEAGWKHRCMQVGGIKLLFMEMLMMITTMTICKGFKVRSSEVGKDCKKKERGLSLLFGNGRTAYLTC